MEKLVQRAFPNIKSKGVDSMQGIRLMILCSISYFLVCAGYKANPIFFEAFLEEFKVSRQDASWPAAVYNFVMNFSGMFLAPLAEKFTIRPVAFVCTLIGAAGYFVNFFVSDLTVLAVAFGGGAGLCFGTMILTVSILMTQYFKEYRTVALGAVFSGGAAGAFIYPSILSFLYKTYGYNVLMLVNGIILSLCLPICYYMKEPEWMEKQEADTQTSQSKKAAILDQLSALLEPSFYVILIPTMTYYWATAACITTMVDFIKEKNYTSDQGKHLAEVIGASEMIGQLFLPSLCNRGYITNEWMAFAVYCLSGVMFMIWTVCPSYISMMVLLAVIGPAFGLASIFYRVFVGDYLGMHRMKMVFGLLVAFKGLMLLGSPSFIGYFVDQRHDYNGMFITCGAIMTSLSFLWVVMAIKKMREKKQTSDEEEARTEAVGDVGTREENNSGSQRDEEDVTN